MRKILFAAVAVSALASASAIAQNAASTNNGAAVTTDKMNSSAVPENGPNFIKVQNTDMLSSNVVGLDIYNGQNNSIGKIQDIAFNASKQMTGYILSVGGFLAWARTMSRSIRTRCWWNTTPTTRRGGRP